MAASYQEPGWRYYASVILAFTALFALYWIFWLQPQLEERERYLQQQRQAQLEKQAQQAEAEREAESPAQPDDNEPEQPGEQSPEAEEQQPTDEPEAEPQGDPEPEAEPEPEVARLDDIPVETGIFHFVFDNQGAGLRKLRYRVPSQVEGRGGFTHQKDSEWGEVLLDALQPSARSFVVNHLSYRLNGRTHTIGNRDAVVPGKGMPAARNWQLVAPLTDDGTPGTLEFGEDGTARVVFETSLRHPKQPSHQFGLRKTYILTEGGYDFDVDLQVINRTGQPVDNLQVSMVGPNGIVPDGDKQEAWMGRYYQVRGWLAARQAGQPVDGAREVMPVEKIEDDDEAVYKYDARPAEGRLAAWGAVTNRFFGVFMRPEEAARVEQLRLLPVATTEYQPRSYDEEPEELTENRTTRIRAQPSSAVAMRTVPISLGVDEETSYQFNVLAAPLQENVLQSYGDDGTNYNLSIRYTWMASLSRLLHVVLDGLHWITGIFPSWLEWGLAVILLTVLVKGALHPLTRKQQVSMHKIQKLQPQLKAIEEKYKGQTSVEAKRKIQNERMELMQRAGANPLGGCLPMLVQFPIFIGLYGLVSAAFELRQSGFLWVDDLSRPDALFGLGFTVPLLGWSTFNLMPLIYAAMMYLQQRLNQPTGEVTEQQKQMQGMMKIMPFFMLFFFYNMPAGLVLYFAASMVFSVVETWRIKSKLAEQDEREGAPAAVAVGPAGAPVVLPTSMEKPPQKKPKPKKSNKKRRRKK